MYIDTKHIGQCETCRHYDEKLKMCKGGMFFCDSGENYSPNMFKIPTADVVEVRHGEWVVLEEEIGLYSCSLCDYKIIRTECNYCPNCGAKMDGGKNENLL